MLYLELLISALYVFQPHAHAIGCGPKFDGATSGEKIVALKTTNDKGVTQYVLDDDGYMVLSMVASYCNEKIYRPEVNLTETQKTCIDDAQEQIESDSRVPSWLIYQGDFENKSLAVTAVKNACKIDMVAIWREADQRHKKSPLECAPDVKALAAKAGARSLEYMKETTSSEYLDGLGATEEQKAEYRTALGASNARVQELVKVVTRPGATNGQFQAALTGFMEGIERRTYPLVSDPDAPYGEDAQKPAEELFGPLNIWLPETNTDPNRPRRVRTRCSWGITKSTIESLSGISWRPRSPAQQQQRQGGNL